MDMREIINLVEAVGQHTITLRDLYDDHELNDESEALFDTVSEDDFDVQFPVYTANTKEAKTFLTARGDMTVVAAFSSFADEEQKELVRDKMNTFDHGRIIVLDGRRVIDGYHHLIAAIKLKHPIKFINLTDRQSGGVIKAV